MPIIKASIKDLRKSNKRRAINKIAKNKLKTTYKEMLKLAKTGKMDEFRQKLPAAYQTIDRSAKNHLLHKNNAARKKSALAKVLAKQK